MIIKALLRIRWMWHFLMLGVFIVSICHGIQFNKWWLCGEWFVCYCIMIYVEYKRPRVKK